MEDGGVQLRAAVKEILTAVAGPRGEEQVRATARMIWREPFAQADVVGAPLPDHRRAARRGGCGLHRSSPCPPGSCWPSPSSGWSSSPSPCAGPGASAGFHRQLARHLSGRGDRGPRAVRRPPGFFGMAAVGPAGPHRMAGDGLRRPQGASGLPRRPGRLHLLVGCLLLPHLPGLGRVGAYSARVRPAAGPLRGQLLLRAGIPGSSTASGSSSPASCSSSRRRGPCGASSTSTGGSCGSCSPPTP